ncbi:MAG: dipeptidase PepE, partial [Gemmatimonas sp.]
AHPPGFQGETRRQRLAEYLTANTGVSVVGLPEGDWLAVNGPSVVLCGLHSAPILRAGEQESIAHPGDSIGTLLER